MATATAAVSITARSCAASPSSTAPGARLSVRDGVQVRLPRAESAAGSSQERQGRAALLTPYWCTGPGRALLLDHTAEDITVCSTTTS